MGSPGRAGYKEARRTRTEFVDTGGAPYADYKRRLSIVLRLLWPKGDTVKSPFWRPDWCTSVVAEASVRHRVTAWKAVQTGHTLIALRNKEGLPLDRVRRNFTTDGSNRLWPSDLTGHPTGESRL